MECLLEDSSDSIELRRARDYTGVMTMRRLAAALLLTCAPALAQEPPPAPPTPPAPSTEPKPEDPEERRVREGLDRLREWSEVGRRIAQLEQELAEATEWVQKAILCIELADLQDPRAVPALGRALRDDDAMVVAFGLRGLAHQRVGEHLRRGGGAPLVEGLIEALKVRAHYHRRVAREQLTRIVGEDLGAEAGRWKTWLKRHEAELPVEAPPAPFDPARHDPAVVERVRTGAPGGGATSVRERIPPVTSEIREMNEVGLDVAICLDQTGSMGAVINECKAKLELLTLLVGLVVKDFRFGLTTFDDGLKVFEPLTNNVAALRATLGQVQAAGGGDEPEGVDKAIDATVRPDFGWRRRSVKTIIVVGDAPPHDADLPPLLDRVGQMRERLQIITNVVSTGSSAVPGLVRIAERGGGRSLLLGEPQRLVSEVLLLIFGERIRPAMERFVPALIEIHEEERDARR
jgi:Mg-chelatase subunit ChlD